MIASWGTTMDCFGGKSMLEKSRERSQTKKYMHRNLAAGHVTPNEHYLERAGLRGRKQWLLGCLLLCVVCIALGHLAVTCLLLGVLRFGVTGFTYFSFSGSSTIWPQGGSLSNVTIATPHGINGFRNTPLTISASEGGEIAAALEGLIASSSFSLVNSSANFNVRDALRVMNTAGQQLLIANGSLLQVNTLSALEGMKMQRLTTHQINEASAIQSARLLSLQGEGGVTVRGGVVNITAGGRVRLSGQHVVLAGAEGIAMPQGRGAATSPSSNYHLCATSNGTLFLIQSNPRRCLGPT